MSEAPNERNRKKIEAVESKQHDFQRWLQGKGITRGPVNPVLGLKSYQEAATFWADKSIEQQCNYEEAHAKGGLKLSRRFQVFGANADRFLQDFSAMVDFAKMAGSPYTGPAFATIGVLFAVGTLVFGFRVG